MRFDRSNPSIALLAVASALAITATACSTTDAAKSKAAAPAFDAQNIDGPWEAYPQFGSKPDPNGPPAPARIPDPPLKSQYVAAWKATQKKVADATAQGKPLASGYVDCLPDGMPAMMMGMFPLEVLKSKGQVTIIEEAYNQVHRIYVGEQQIKSEDAEPYFWGHSVGHWEGNTLVANTIGIKPEVQFRNTPHSDQMSIDERISLINANFMKDDVTVTDPVYLTGPWIWTWEYKRMPGYKIQEYVCEANREYMDPKTGEQKMRVPKPR
jgi:hypothetical protein